MRGQYQILIFLIFVTILACQKKAPEGTLQRYIDDSGLALSNRLIACAAGGQQGFLEDPLIVNNIFFLPIEGASDFRYFETTNISANPDDWGTYREMTLPVQPVFNGYLQRFERSGLSQEVWSRVTYVVNDSLHICNAIRMKEPEKPTEFNPTLIQHAAQGGQVAFNWQDGLINENAIYFQVVSDQAGNLITGTYTYDRNFTFYDLSNVVLNIRPLSMNPVLVPGDTYVFTLMAVSIDNWVNLIGQVEFVAP